MRVCSLFSVLGSQKNGERNQRERARRKEARSYPSRPSGHSGTHAPSAYSDVHGPSTNGRHKQRALHAQSSNGRNGNSFHAKPTSGPGSQSNEPTSYGS